MRYSPARVHKAIIDAGSYASVTTIEKAGHLVRISPLPFHMLIMRCRLCKRCRIALEKPYMTR